MKLCVLVVLNIDCEAVWVQIPALPFTSYMTLVAECFSDSFSYLQNGYGNRTCSVDVMEIK